MFDHYQRSMNRKNSGERSKLISEKNEKGLLNVSPEVVPAIVQSAVVMSPRRQTLAKDVASNSNRFQNVPKEFKLFAGGKKTSGKDRDSFRSSTSAAASDGAKTQTNEIGPKKLNRLIDRKGKYHQSKGSFTVDRKGDKNLIETFYKADWFHSIVDFKLEFIVFACVGVYLCIAVLFGCLYFMVSVRWYECDMGIDNFMKALYFSLETQVSIGYSTQDIFFGDCVAPFILISSQSMVDFFLEASMFGIIFTRISRATTRAETIHFSDKAAVYRSGSHFHFSFRIYELRKHQLSEAHVRCYAIRHTMSDNGNVVEYFSPKFMDLQEPDSSMGGFMFLAIPQTVVHRIDDRSPFMPLNEWKVYRGLKKRPDSISDEDSGDEFGRTSFNTGTGGIVMSESQSTHFPGALPQYTDDCVPSRAKAMSFEPHPSHAPEAPPDKGTDKKQTKFDKQTRDLLLASEQELIQSYVADSELEVVVLVEGIDAATSSTVQARHSYKGDDIVWNQEFVQCVSRGENGSCMVDLGKFHKTTAESMERRYPGFRKHNYATNKRKLRLAIQKGRARERAGSDEQKKTDTSPGTPEQREQRSMSLAQIL